jgi:hypothetical protein
VLPFLDVVQRHPLGQLAAADPVEELADRRAEVAG